MMYIDIKEYAKKELAEIQLVLHGPILNPVEKLMAAKVRVAALQHFFDALEIEDDK
jgi:hypothetical protein